MLPILVVYIVQCQVSLNRINKFINSEELDPEAVSHEKANEAMVKAVDATYTWGEQLQPAIGKICLKNIGTVLCINRIRVDNDKNGHVKRV